MQRRPLLARLGRRTVLILGIPYVHQLLEAYVSKLFSLSYGVASVDVHGADTLCTASPTGHWFKTPYQPPCFFCFLVLLNCGLQSRGMLTGRQGEGKTRQCY